MTQIDDGQALDRIDLTSLEDVLAQICDVEQFRAASESSLEAAADFWRAPMVSGHLEPRMKELVLIGMHASVTTLNVQAVKRHVKRALIAGATPAEVVDVLITIVALANHALYFSVPILQEELIAAGLLRGDSETPLDPEYEAAKQAFINARGFWNADRDLIARHMPDYYKALDAVSKESWNNGPLSAKERAFVCIGIDSTVTHNYEPGLRRHIRNALANGASADEILEVLQLSGMIGLESYILGASALFGDGGQE